MSAIDNYEVHHPSVNTEEDRGPLPQPLQRKQKKVIYFSDGSTMEMDEGGDTVDAEEEQEIKTEPEVDPTTLRWTDWIKYYSRKSASSIIHGVDYTGETLAYYLGITTPKYQREIDEYNKMMEKRKKYEEEAEAWKTTNPTPVPIVMDQIPAAGPALELEQFQEREGKV